MTNGHWYHKNPYPDNFTLSSPQHNTIHARVHKLTHRALYELYHQRLGHCGKKILSKVHKHIKGIPQLKGNSFYLCASCALSKITRRHQTPSHSLTSFHPSLRQTFHVVHASTWTLAFPKENILRRMNLVGASLA
jgi:hypothetical protein